MFTSARLRLTVWYLLILALIVGGLSAILYRLMLYTQDAELRAAGASQHSLVHAFARDELILAYQITAADLGVLLLAVVGAYLLAGRTLRPIEQTVERQRRFAGAASHELRTPLTALQGNLEVALLRERTPDEYQEVIREAVQETERMGHLIKDLVILARPERDSMVLNRASLDLREVATSAAEDVEPLARAKNQTLETDLISPLPSCGDAMKLRQVFVNLLENAVTYTPEGGAICLTGRGERGHALFEVRDTGQGISPEDLPHLFEPFYQADSARSNVDHVGLGLSLASWIVRTHGGQIAVQSQMGVGTVFTVSLPLVQGDWT